MKNLIIRILTISAPGRSLPVGRSVGSVPQGVQQSADPKMVKTLSCRMHITVSVLTRSSMKFIIVINIIQSLPLSRIAKVLKTLSYRLLITASVITTV